MSVNVQLPSEIVERIVCFLDGKSLLQARTVCKQWRDVIDGLFQRYSNRDWHRLALDTIPYNTILEYVGDGHPANIQMMDEYKASEPDRFRLLEGQRLPRNSSLKKTTLDYSLLDWQAIFKRHQTLSNSLAWNEADIIKIDVADFVPFEDNPVSCAKINGDCVFTGHTNGLICMWASEDPTLLMMICENLHWDKITDIIFGDIFQVGPYALNRNCGDEKIYYVNKHFMVSTSSDGQVATRGIGTSEISETGVEEGKIESIKLARHGKNVAYISICGNILCTIGRDSSISLWEFSAPSHFVKEAWKLPRFLPIREVIGPPHGIAYGRIWPNKMAFWQKKLVVLTGNGLNQTMIFPRMNRDDPMLPQQQQREPRWEAIPVNKAGKMRLVTDNKKVEDANQSFAEKTKTKCVTIRSYDHLFMKNDEVPKKDIKMKPLSSLHLYHTFGIEPEAEKDDFSSYKLNLSDVTALVKSFRDDLYVIVNRRRQLLISLDGIYYRICGPFKNEYRGHVTAVHFYGNVFVMGFDSGHFSVFFTQGPFDLMSLDLEKSRPNFEGQVCIDQIKDIDIAPGIEFDNDVDAEVHVSLATHEAVYLIVIKNNVSETEE